MALRACLNGDVRNNLLHVLRAEDYALLAPHLNEWSGAARQPLYNPGDEVTHVYFPCGPTVVCFLVVLEDGQTVEAALVGREGAIGGVVSEGNLPAYTRVEVQAPGPMLRITTRKLDAAKTRSPALRELFARYADCLLAQIFQAVACNAAHTIEQRTAKWLLSAMDRTGQCEFSLTQDQLAGMLGIGRSYFTRVAKNLKAHGLIETQRGRIRVKDRAKLMSVSCRCNETFRRHFEIALQGVYPAPPC